MDPQDSQVVVDQSLQDAVPQQQTTDNIPLADNSIITGENALHVDELDVLASFRMWKKSADCHTGVFHYNVKPA